MKEEIEIGQVKKALESFVHHGVLLKTKKDGEDAYMENPEFNRKTKKEQEEIFDIIKTEEDIGLFA